jgi:hypothetical protein
MPDVTGRSSWTFKLEFSPSDYSSGDKQLEEAVWAVVQEAKDKLLALGMLVSTERKYGGYEYDKAARELKA